MPLLYVLLALTVVAWVGMRLSSASRPRPGAAAVHRGYGPDPAASAFFATRALGRGPLIGVGTALALLLCAMAVVAAGALLPTVEDWIGARQELRLIEPLRREMDARHPDVGIGVRPRGPLVFQVAERLSLISDALTSKGRGLSGSCLPPARAAVACRRQRRRTGARRRRGIRAGRDAGATAFRGEAGCASPGMFRPGVDPRDRPPIPGADETVVTLARRCGNSGRVDVRLTA